MRFGRKKDENIENGYDAPQGVEKMIEVVKLGTDNKPESIENVGIVPKTKGIDVKEKLGHRASDTLIRAKTEEVLPNNTDLYETLNDGEKLVIVHDTTVGQQAC